MGTESSTVCATKSVMSKKVIVISQPKAGTYLCANVLQELGLRFDGYHLGEKKYEKYPPPSAPHYQAAIRDPKTVETRQRLHRSVKLIEPGAFAVSHLLYTIENELLLADYHKICVTRPETEIIDSLKRWEQFSGRKPTNMTPTLARIRSVAKWIGRPGVFHLTFNNMKSADATRIDQLQEFLGIQDRVDSSQLCARALQRGSKTKVT